MHKQAAAPWPFAKPASHPPEAALIGPRLACAQHHSPQRASSHADFHYEAYVRGCLFVLTTEHHICITLFSYPGLGGCIITHALMKHR